MKYSRNIQFLTIDYYSIQICTSALIHTNVAEYILSNPLPVRNRCGATLELRSSLFVWSLVSVVDVVRVWGSGALVLLWRRSLLVVVLVVLVEALVTAVRLIVSRGAWGGVPCCLLSHVGVSVGRLVQMDDGLMRRGPPTGRFLQTSLQFKVSGRCRVSLLCEHSSVVLMVGVLRRARFPHSLLRAVLTALVVTMIGVLLADDAVLDGGRRWLLQLQRCRLLLLQFLLLKLLLLL